MNVVNKFIAGHCYCEDCSNCLDCRPGSNPNPPGNTPGNYPGEPGNPGNPGNWPGEPGNPGNNYPGGKPATPILNLHTIKMGYTFDAATGEKFLMKNNINFFKPLLVRFSSSDSSLQPVLTSPVLAQLHIMTECCF